MGDLQSQLFREQLVPLTTPGIALVVVENRIVWHVVGTFVGWL